MAEETKTLHEQLNRAWEEMKSVLAERDVEIRKYGEEREETKSLLDKLDSRLDEIEAKGKRPDHAPEQTVGSEKKAIFEKWLRKGDQVIAPEEKKALTLADDTQTGYLAPAEYVNEIIKGIIDFSPVRQLVNVRTTSQRSIKIPKRTGVFSAKWVGEIETRTETTGLKYGMVEIPTHEMYALVDISLQDLEDSAFNLEAELMAEFAEQFGVLEGKVLISGDGTPQQPEGLLVNGDIGVTKSGSNDALLADALLQTAYDIKTPYANNGTWILNRATMAIIRRLKTGDGIFLWQPGLAGGHPSTIDGRPYVECPDMPNSATNAYPVMFGDFRRGYTLVERLVISIQRDPYTQATNGAVRFIARRRMGGQVTLAEAIRKHQRAA